MFHLITYDSISRNIPLEHLQEKRNKVPKSHKTYSGRKTFIDDHDQKNTSQKAVSYNNAVKAYKDSAKLSEKNLLLHAKDIMNNPVLTISKDSLRKEAWQMMQQKNISHLPVINEENKIIGIISDRDIMKGTIIEDDKIISQESASISEIMSQEVITADPLTDIRRIAKAMFYNHISTMPIISDSDELTGIVTRSDILHALIHYPDLQLWG